MTVGSLFSGVGGFDIGLEMAGMITKWQVEIDEEASKYLEKHWPHVQRYQDIREVGAHNLEPVDVICGGFPCQPFSVAGKQEGAADDRYLWPEMLRVIEEIKPAWVIGENVAGLASMAQFDSGPPMDADGNALGAVGETYDRTGRGYLEKILGSLESLGYETQPFIVPAAGVGAHHRRDRVWIVAHTVNERSCERRAGGDGSMAGSGRTRKEAGDHLPATPESSYVVHTPSERPGKAGRLRRDESEERIAGCGEDVSDTNEKRLPESEPKPRQERTGRTGFGSCTSSSSGRSTLAGLCLLAHGLSPQLVPTWAGGEWDMPAPCVVGKYPGRVGMLKALGNAVTPMIPYQIGRAIIAAEQSQL